MGRTIGVTEPVYGRPPVYVPQIYGSAAYLRMGPAGAFKPSLTDPCVCEPGFDPLLSLTLLEQFIEILLISMKKFYVATAVQAPFSADMAFRGRMSFKVFVRILWGRQNPGKMFNVFSQAHINQLKDIYLSHGVDWRSDKFLAEWKPPMAGRGADDDGSLTMPLIPDEILRMARK
jgi:hypothetical protein